VQHVQLASSPVVMDHVLMFDVSAMESQTAVISRMNKAVVGSLFFAIILLSKSHCDTCTSTECIDIHCNLIETSLTTDKCILVFHLN